MSSFKGQHNINKNKAFWSKVDVKDIHDCWNYKEYKNSGGYGIFRGHNGDKIGAHVFAWEYHYNRKVPKGMLICHHCDNPTCCNHMHLYCGTYTDNAQDKIKRNRVDPRKLAANSKLYEGEMWLVRKLGKSGIISHEKIAAMFKMRGSSISLIITGKTKYPRRY